ncbi:hypothetical protein CONLIGDRAFT_450436 [Coniochaeta ligniaria NRRL 30616]|uniref:Uncharacterized protein n=1 Tax=Coniochaeta ligniaria NRRL 30616 TaxID=1408157 RepID=A0A1J7JEU6_9PEZI|nr:hypothetical protein CONLIGDRAFT_450436 [Coniochaeta ligniaria NRRL 30616]
MNGWMAGSRRALSSPMGCVYLEGSGCYQRCRQRLPQKTPSYVTALIGWIGAIPHLGLERDPKVTPQVRGTSLLCCWCHLVTREVVSSRVSDLSGLSHVGDSETWCFVLERLRVKGCGRNRHMWSNKKHRYEEMGSL